ncbi:YgaB family protein [Bacillus massiliglaciei]|uniref:YgaB family protein n=1 Tax=Bacillus massiliglaciei TaxID=1816693 RepID=UPI000DA5EE01|nr:YgaB family protein [Bacillus massiliglaciei]
MEEFDQLIQKQLQTMDKLLFLQSEIERCQDIESQLSALQEMSKADTVKDEISKKQSELQAIHDMFEKQTEEVIRYFQKSQASILK